MTISNIHIEGKRVYGDYDGFHFVIYSARKGYVYISDVYRHRYILADPVLEAKDRCCSIPSNLIAEILGQVPTETCPKENEKPLCKGPERKRKSCLS